MPAALIFLISVASMVRARRRSRPPLTFRFCEFAPGHTASWRASATSCSCVRISNFSTIRCRCATMRHSVSPRSAAISLSVFPAANRRKSNFSRGLTYGKLFISTRRCTVTDALGYAILSNSVSLPSMWGWQRVSPQVATGLFQACFPTNFSFPDGAANRRCLSRVRSDERHHAPWPIERALLALP